MGLSPEFHPFFPLVLTSGFNLGLSQLLVCFSIHLLVFCFWFKVFWPIYFPPFWTLRGFCPFFGDELSPQGGVTFKPTWGFGPPFSSIPSWTRGQTIRRKIPLRGEPPYKSWRIRPLKRASYTHKEFGSVEPAVQRRIPYNRGFGKGGAPK